MKHLILLAVVAATAANPNGRFLTNPLPNLFGALASKAQPPTKHCDTVSVDVEVKDCVPLWKDDCQTKNVQVCGTTWTTECFHTPKKECRIGFKDQCQKLLPYPQCKTVYRKQCVKLPQCTTTTTEKCDTVQEKVCKQVPINQAAGSVPAPASKFPALDFSLLASKLLPKTTTQCTMVPKEHCTLHPKTDCGEPIQSCKEVPRRECNVQFQPICVKVPTNICHTVNKQVCSKKPKTDCIDDTKEVCKKVRDGEDCKTTIVQRPKEVCHEIEPAPAPVPQDTPSKPNLLSVVKGAVSS